MAVMTYTAFIEEQLRRASDIALSHFGNVTSTVKPEDNNQVLTEADLAVGNYLVASVKKEYPEHNIIDEEAGVIDNGSCYTWVIDPIDGTANFAAGLAEYGIMIGLLEDSRPIAGGIALPSQAKVYLAEKGHGATCNGEVIRATDEPLLSNVLVAFGVDGIPDEPEKNRQQCEVLADLLPNIRNMRNSGSDAIDPVRIAEGKYGAKIEVYSKIWDNVAPQVICEEAGAVWTSANGTPADYSNHLSRVNENFTYCAAPPQIHDQLQKIIAGRLKA